MIKYQLSNNIKYRWSWLNTDFLLLLNFLTFLIMPFMNWLIGCFIPNAGDDLKTNLNARRHCWMFLKLRWNLCGYVRSVVCLRTCGAGLYTAVQHATACFFFWPKELLLERNTRLSLNTVFCPCLFVSHLLLWLPFNMRVLTGAAESCTVIISRHVQHLETHDRKGFTHAKKMNLL